MLCTFGRRKSDCREDVAVRPTAVIMNDTRRHRHFGCARVMRVIEENLSRRGIVVTGRSLLWNDWQHDRRFLAAMTSCDVIVINGEGTLHHGAESGRRLLEVVDHPLRGKTPVALINALYQQNPVAWRHSIEKIDLLTARDSRSAEELRQVTGRPVDVVPDLSLADSSGRLLDELPRRDLVYVGDSVVETQREQLARAGRAGGDVRILPILLSRHAVRPELPPGVRQLREGWKRLLDAVFRLGAPRAICPVDERDYLRWLQRGRLHVTGRFHAVCLSLVTRTPFLAVTSNSWKIEALLEDAGLGNARIITADAIADAVADPGAFAFSEVEEAAIDRFLDRCKAGCGRIFDAVERLAMARHADRCQRAGARYDKGVAFGPNSRDHRTREGG